MAAAVPHGVGYAGASTPGQRIQADARHRQFEYCETLTRDGYLDRDVLTGYYILKGPGHMAAYGAPYNPALY